MNQVLISFAIFVYLISKEIAFYSAMFWGLIIILILFKIFHMMTGIELFTKKEHFTDEHNFVLPLPNLDSIQKGISKGVSKGELFSQNVKMPKYSIKNKCKFVNSDKQGTCNARFSVYSGASFGSSDKSLTCNGENPDNITAKAAAKITDGMISEIIIVDNGINYKNAPKVTISGGGGKGASCIGRVNNGKITQIDIINPGSNYNSSPDVIISDPDGINYCNFCCKVE